MTGHSVPPEFVSLAGRWCANQSANLLASVWQGYDLLSSEPPSRFDRRDLERSITQLLELRIRKVMSGDEPYDVQHSPRERETMKSRGQPPEYDLAYVLRADERIMWPLEAKVLETDGDVGEYIKDLKNEFLTCRYAPFSSEGAMLAYLLSGKPEIVFGNLATKIPCRLTAHQDSWGRHHKTSDQQRQVEKGKPYPKDFCCHHLIMEFPSLARSSKRI